MYTYTAALVDINHNNIKLMTNKTETPFKIQVD